MKSFSAILVLLVVLLLGPVVTGAEEDRVYLKTGAVLAGRILAETDDLVVIRIPNLGRIEVHRDQIDHVETGVRPPEPVPEPVPAPPPEDEPPEPPDEPPPDPIEVPYSQVKPGQKLLVLLAGEQHETWTETGLRYVAKIPVLSERRAKLVFDAEAGVKGYVWIRRDRIRKLIRLENDPERLFLFLEGVAAGAWIEGSTFDRASFAGQLIRVTDSGVVHLLVPEDGGVQERQVRLAQIRIFSAVAPKAPLRSKLESLQPGEPVALTIRGREEIQGILRARDRAWLTVETLDPATARVTELKLFAGLPVLDARILPEKLREVFRGLPRGGYLTADFAEENEKQVVRRSITGELFHATPDRILLSTPTGRVEVEVAKIKALTRPEEDKIAALTGRVRKSTSDTSLPVLPGMSREEAEAAVAAGQEGVEFICEEGKVARVFCRPPFAGLVFGIRLGSGFATALRETDLVFDTQIDPKIGPEPRVSTMLSHTLDRFVVKLYVAKTGEVLAAEIVAR